MWPVRGFDRDPMKALRVTKTFSTDGETFRMKETVTELEEVHLLVPPGTRFSCHTACTAKRFVSHRVHRARTVTRYDQPRAHAGIRWLSAGLGAKISVDNKGSLGGHRPWTGQKKISNIYAQRNIKNTY